MSHLVARGDLVVRQPVQILARVTTRAVAHVTRRTRATNLVALAERASAERRVEMTSARRVRQTLAGSVARTLAAPATRDPLALIHVPRALAATLVPRVAAMRARHDRAGKVLVPTRVAPVPILAAHVLTREALVPILADPDPTLAEPAPILAELAPTHEVRVPTRGALVPIHEVRARRAPTPLAKCHQKRWNVAAQPSTVAARGGGVSREKVRCT
jgi:hypothetical protein